MWPAVNQGFEQDAFRQYVAGLSWNTWRPSLIVWHNTGAPTIEQWMAYPDQYRIYSLIEYWQHDRGWSGCPHLVISPRNLIWVVNPLTAPGVHSPSWNHLSIGIEMVGDYDVEDDETDPGNIVKRNGIFATAVLCSAFGLDPAAAIRLHKEDPLTTHKDCPGEHLAQDKAEMVQQVQELMAGGEHTAGDMTKALNLEPRVASVSSPKYAVVIASILNFRATPAITGDLRGELPNGTRVETMETAGFWTRVKTPAGYVGWVATRYLKED